MQWRRPTALHDQLLETYIRHAAGEQGFDLAIPSNAFLVAKKTSSGWLLENFRDVGAAFDKASSLVHQGIRDVYVLNSFDGGVVGFDREGKPQW